MMPVHVCAPRLVCCGAAVACDGVFFLGAKRDKALLGLPHMRCELFASEQIRWVFLVCEGALRLFGLVCESVTSLDDAYSLLLRENGSVLPGPCSSEKESCSCLPRELVLA